MATEPEKLKVIKPSISYSSCRPQLHSKYGKNDWFDELLGYLTFRFPSIETRILNTFRYVELAPRNAATFSYEFASITRDIGSTFGSILDKLVRNTTTEPKDIYDIRDYRRFLADEVEEVETISVQLNSPFLLNRILPFENVGNIKRKLNWWVAYNNLKHSEIDNYEDGSLTNVIYGMGSLAILYTLMHPYRRAEGRLFNLIGYSKPIEMVRKALFPK